MLNGYVKKQSIKFYLEQKNNIFKIYGHKKDSAKLRKLKKELKVLMRENFRPEFHLILKYE